MTTDDRKNALLEQFRRYLEQTENSENGEPETVDLSTLLAEMAALKAEVKLESRNARNSLDTMSSTLSVLEADNLTLREELQRHEEKLLRRDKEITRALMLELLDLHDRLMAGFDMLKRYRPIKRLFKRSRERDIRLIGRFAEGQEMTLQRLEQLLRNRQVRPIDCIGKGFDPETMNAVATGSEPRFENGVVLEELRKGFTFRGRVLRLAEVKVNKLQPAVSAL